MITTASNTKISEVENKIPDTSTLVTATVFLIKKIGEDEKETSHAKYVSQCFLYLATM